jgi:hypothetical protein
MKIFEVIWPRPTSSGKLCIPVPGVPAGSLWVVVGNCSRILVGRWGTHWLPVGCSRELWATHWWQLRWVTARDKPCTSWPSWWDLASGWPGRGLCEYCDNPCPLSLAMITVAVVVLICRAWLQPQAPAIVWRRQHQDALPISGPPGLVFWAFSHCRLQ